MQVKTQPFKEAIEIKNDGICFDVYGNGSKRLGDLCVTRAGLVWSKGPNGKTSRGEGINVKWEEFINWVQSRRSTAAKTAGAGRSTMAGGAAMKPQAGSGRLASTSATAKAPSQAGKAAARRASAMRLSATESRSERAGATGATGTAARLTGAASGTAKATVAKPAQSKTKPKGVAAAPAAGAAATPARTTSSGSRTGSAGKIGSTARRRTGSGVA